MGEPRHPRAVGGSAGTRQGSARVVHQLLRSSIKSGVLKPGDPLREEQLIADHHSTRTAVRAALQMLADEGLVSRQRRVGTVVRGKPVQIMMHDVIAAGTRSPIEYRMVNDSLVPCTGLIRERLQTTVEQVRMVEYVLSLGGRPIGTLVAFQVDPAAHSPVHDPDMDDIASTFAAIFGVPFGRMDCWVDAVAADEPTARMLDVHQGAVLLVRDQILVDADGNVQEFACAHYRADLVSFYSAPGRPGAGGVREGADAAGTQADRAPGGSPDGS